jgi:hypothetical protein
MEFELETYRNSIWTMDPRFDLAALRTLSDQELAGMSRMLSVNMAKIRVPPAGLMSQLEIYRLAVAMPDDPAMCTVEMYERFLSGTCGKHKGIGITTAACMLAVEKSPVYPMYDEFGADGLLAHGDISTDELAALKSKNIKRFARAYVERLIPIWARDRQGRTVQETDLLWRNYAKRRNKPSAIEGD